MTAPIVSARELVQSYGLGRALFGPRVEVKAVRGVSFDIAPGRTLAVVGESGSGKSTLARMVALIEKPRSGSLMIDGLDAVTPAPEHKSRLRAAVQMVFQNPYASLNPRKKVSSILAEPLRNATDLPAGERAQRVAKMIERVGLRPEHADRYPHMFSGGQRQRVAIARALILEPKIVVADEPVSALDVSIQAQVLNLLQDLQAQTGVAFLFITHDLSVVRHIAHDVLVLYLGTPIEHGDRAAIFARPLHPYTMALMSSTPDTTGRRRDRIVLKGELPSPFATIKGCVFASRCAYVTDRCRVEPPPLREVEGRLVACHYAGTISANLAVGT